MQELGVPADDLFESIDEEPLGAASIGQVHLLWLCLLWLHLLCSTYQDFLIVAGVVAMPRDELLLRMEHGDMQTVTGGAVLYPQVCPCPLLVQSTSTPTILALTTLLELLYLTYLRAYPTLLPYPLTLP